MQLDPTFALMIFFFFFGHRVEPLRGFATHLQVRHPVRTLVAQRFFLSWLLMTRGIFIRTGMLEKTIMTTVSLKCQNLRFK